MASSVQLLKKLQGEYGLLKSDYFTSKQDYTIVTLSGIEKIEAKINVRVEFDVIHCDSDFACFRARAIGSNGVELMQTFGSAKKGEYVSKTKKNKAGKEYTYNSLEGGNTDSFYIPELAEKRGRARIVLKAAGLYQDGVKGEDENLDEFKNEQEEVAKKAADLVNDLVAKKK